MLNALLYKFVLQEQMILSNVHIWNFTLKLDVHLFMMITLTVLVDLTVVSIIIIIIIIAVLVA